MQWEEVQMKIRLVLRRTTAPSFPVCLFSEKKVITAICHRTSVYICVFPAWGLFVYIQPWWMQVYEDDAELKPLQRQKQQKKRSLGVSDGSGLHFRFVCVPGDKNGTAGPWHTADPYVNPAGKFNLCHYLWCVCVLAWSGGTAGSSRCTRCRLQRGGRWGRLNRSLRMDKQVTQTC